MLFVKYVFRRRVKANGKTVFVDVSDPRLERYLYWLLKMFDIAGWNVSIKFRPWLLLNLRNHSEWIYDIRSLSICIQKPDNADVFLSSKQEAGGITLDTDYFSSKRSALNFRMPFFVSPEILHSGLYQELPFVRRSARHIKVFIGGNLDDEYEKSGVESRFGIVNRAAIRRVLEDHFELASSVAVIATEPEADAILESHSDLDLFILRKNVVTVDKWISILASTNFFIAPPGTIMPFSHNIIEAMAMGAIPITQYGRLFDPPLEDGKTCIHFNDDRDLIRVVREAINATDSEIDCLRKNVVDYYNSHLVPNKIVDKIDDSANSIDRIYLIAGHLSVTGQ